MRRDERNLLLLFEGKVSDSAAGLAASTWPAVLKATQLKNAGPLLPLVL